MIETLNDIVATLADQMGVYGAHGDKNDSVCKQKPCRMCWTKELTDRIWEAVRFEQQLERGREPVSPSPRCNPVRPGREEK